MQPFKRVMAAKIHNTLSCDLNPTHTSTNPIAKNASEMIL